MQMNEKINNYEDYSGKRTSKLLHLRTGDLKHREID